MVGTPATTLEPQVSMRIELSAEDEGGVVKRIKMCQALVPIPQDECDHFGLQTFTNKKF